MAASPKEKKRRRKGHFLPWDLRVDWKEQTGYNNNTTSISSTTAEGSDTSTERGASPGGDYYITPDGLSAAFRHKVVSEPCALWCHLSAGYTRVYTMRAGP